MDRYRCDGNFCDVDLFYGFHILGCFGVDGMKSMMAEKDVKELASEILSLMRSREEPFEACFGALGLVTMHLAGSLGLSKLDFKIMMEDMSQHYGGPGRKE